jgi:asparagine synthase (glutamine-hydrolysing)
MVKSAKPDLCGDFLLFFGELEPPGGRTGRAWRAIFKSADKHEDAALWCQNPAETWRGAPFREIPLREGRAWLFGELFGGSEAALEAVARGERSAESLNGHFLFIVRDDESREWTIHTDRLGTFHAYVARRGQRVAVGTSFRAVAGAASARRLDWQALAGFFRCGFFPADLTPYDDVSILRPARRYVFSPQGELRAARRYWQWQHQPSLAGEEAVERFGQLLHEVVGEMAAEGRIALPLSGGLDSRSLLAALPNGAGSDGGRLWAFSYGYGRGSAETRIAGRLAKKREMPFRGFRVPPYLFDRLQDVHLAIEGFQDLTQTRQAAFADEIGRQADYVLGGHWGDVWLDDMGLAGRRVRPSGTEVVDHALSRISKRGGEELAELLCRGPLGDDPAALTRQGIQREIQALGEIEDADFLVKAFKTDQWSARSTTASLRAYQLAAFPRLPFYDNRLVDFFTSVGSTEVAGRRLELAYLKKLAPDLAGVAWQETGVDLFHSHWPGSMLLPLRALHKAARVVGLETKVERNWEAQFLHGPGRAGLEHWLLRPALRLHDHLPPKSARELLERFYARPEPALGYQLSMLLSFSVFLEAS